MNLCEEKMVDNGSFTVEATFIICITIWIIISTMYLAFYVHDEAAIYTMSQEYMDGCIRENEDVDDKDFKAYLNKHTMLCKVTDVNTNKSLLKCQTNIKYMADINLGFTGVLMSGMKEKDMCVEHENRNPVRELWLVNKDIKEDGEDEINGD